MTWNPLYVFGWLVILAWLLVWEIYALIYNGVHDPMLTQVTVRYVPWWVTMPFIIWLFVHFALRYANPTYVNHLKTGA